MLLLIGLGVVALTLKLPAQPAPPITMLGYYRR